MKNTPPKVQVPPAPHPDYLRIHSLQEKQDHVHSVPMVDASGTTWYIEAKAAFNLDSFDYRDACVTKTDDDYYIVMPIPASSDCALRSWSNDRIGRRIAVIIDNELQQVAEINTHWSSMLHLRLRENKLAEYRVAVSAINAGGIAASTSRPSDRGNTTSRPSSL